MVGSHLFYRPIATIIFSAILFTTDTQTEILWPPDNVIDVIESVVQFNSSYFSIVAASAFTNAAISGFERTFCRRTGSMFSGTVTFGGAGS